MAQILLKEPILFTTLDELKKYKPNQQVQFVCSQCGTSSSKYRCNISLPLLCSSCKRKEAMKHFNWEERNKKSQLTKLKKYGDPFYTNREKANNTYNSKTKEEKDEIKQKIRENNIKKYGMHPAQRSSQKEKTKQTCIERYGCETPFQNKDVQEKYKATMLKKYGVDNGFKSDVIKQKIKETNLKKYGCENPSQNAIISENRKKTCLEIYGYEHPWSNHDVRKKCMANYTYDGKMFDSSWELYYYIWLQMNNIVFTYQPDINFVYGDNKRYYPDFLVNGELFEIKGEQFFDGDKMINPYDRSQDLVYEQKHQCMLQNDVTILRKPDMEKIFEEVNEKYGKDFVNLFRNGIDFPYPNSDLKDKSYQGVIRHFHKSIYEANRKGFKSPIQAWEDKELVRKSALNRIKFVGHARPNDIIYGFNVAKIAPKVSVFNPTLGVTLINSYLSDCNEIFDPFSGFSGRMIASQICGKKYIGRDINQTHIDESKEICDFYSYSDVTLSVKDIHDCSNETFEALFTCPPYLDKEEWNEENNDNIKTCDEWIDMCVSKFNCKKYLFIVDETIKYQKNIVYTIDNTSHFNNNKEYVILIQK